MQPISVLAWVPDKDKDMNILLWILPVLFGIYFIAVGIMHFFVPLDLPQSMSWMYDLSPGLHYFIGTAEILGGMGLIMPGIVNVQTRLTPLAGAYHDWCSRVACSAERISKHRVKSIPRYGRCLCDVWTL